MPAPSAGAAGTGAGLEEACEVVERVTMDGALLTSGWEPQPKGTYHDSHGQRPSS